MVSARDFTIFIFGFLRSTYFHILKSLNTHFRLKICPQNANVIFYWRVYFAVWKSYELLWRKRLRAFQLKFVKKWVKNNVRFICLNLQIWPIDIDSMVFFCWKTGILHQQFEMCGLTLKSNDTPTIYLHLIFEISSSWNWFLNLISVCVACKNPVRNKQKIKFKNQFCELDI